MRAKKLPIPNKAKVVAQGRIADKGKIIAKWQVYFSDLALDLENNWIRFN